MRELTLAEFSRMTGLSEEVLVGRDRSRQLSTARQIHWLHLRHKKHSYDKIAKIYRRRRASIISGIKTIKNLIETEDVLIAPYRDFVDSFSCQKNN